MGKGTFGKVYLGENLLVKHSHQDCNLSNSSYKWKQNQVAIKVIRSVEKYIDSAKIEAEILQNIRQKILENDETMSKGQNIIIMEETFHWKGNNIFLGYFIKNLLILL